MTAIMSEDATPPSKCHLLALPPEIRNHIYEIVSTDTSATRSLTGRITSPVFALAATCRKVRHEYLPYAKDAIPHAVLLNVTVDNLDFTALAKFLEEMLSSVKLPEGEDAYRDGGRLRVKLQLTDSMNALLSHGTGLVGWLARRKAKPLSKLRRWYAEIEY